MDRAGVSNSFSAVGRIYIPGFYMSQAQLKKNLSRQDCISVVPKRFCLLVLETSGSNFVAHQPQHYLEITTSPGDNLRKLCDVAQNGDFQKNNNKKVITSFVVTCNATCDFIAVVNHYIMVIFT